jgi:signal transduction histidine kinase
VQRLFGVSMALDGEGDLPADDRRRCAEETQAALGELRSALQRPLGRTPRKTGTTLRAEVHRLASEHPDLGVVLVGEDDVVIPDSIEPLAQSVLTEAVRNAHKHANPTRVEVRVSHPDSALVLEVSNDGVRGRSPGIWQVRLVVPDDG